ncbi:hypothetical protein BCR44DRAFT_95096 [Catenaria anguillulae PL171]|uniref:Uncharacterized protein n=1 Tax=Catenaria anguillulae PL171 TaxID=765915 RepID=A0A1Y2I0Q5_9FUNG|nr:hypothetical protein BCR44DRAFT_95096 [Catenaria anguillulae PL171]
MTMAMTIIEDHVARNSIAIYTLSGLTALTAILLLVPKLFPSIAFRSKSINERKQGSHYGLNRAASTGTMSAAPPRRSISTLRMYLIIFSALLMIADAINSCIMIASVWSTGKADWMEFHIFRALTFTPAGPIFTVGLAQRIAVIVVMSPTWQMWFLRTVYVVCTWVSLQQQVFMIVGPLQLAAQPHISDREWYDAFFVPQWSTAIVAIIPVITIGGSLWSLKIAFRHSKVKPSVSSAGAGTSSAVGAGTGPGSSTGEAATSSSNGGVTVVVPSSTLAGASAAKKSTDNLTLSGSRSIENLSRSSGPQVAQPTVVGLHRTTQAVTIKYALTTTFKILTFLMLVWWILFLIMITLRNSHLPFRSSSMSSLIVSCALVTESSFEWLLKMRRKRHLHQHSRTGNGASRDHLGANASGLGGAGGSTRFPGPLGQGAESVRVGGSRELLALPATLLGAVQGTGRKSSSSSSEKEQDAFHRPSF